MCDRCYHCVIERALKDAHVIFLALLKLFLTNTGLIFEFSLFFLLLFCSATLKKPNWGPNNICMCVSEREMDGVVVVLISVKLRPGR